MENNYGYSTQVIVMMIRPISIAACCSASIIYSCAKRTCSSIMVMHTTFIHIYLLYPVIEDQKIQNEYSYHSRTLPYPVVLVLYRRQPAPASIAVTRTITITELLN